MSQILYAGIEFIIATLGRWVWKFDKSQLTIVCILCVSLLEFYMSYMSFIIMQPYVYV